jgi:hypothetical protein
MVMMVMMMMMMTIIIIIIIIIITAADELLFRPALFTVMLEMKICRNYNGITGLKINELCNQIWKKKTLINPECLYASPFDSFIKSEQWNLP